jgi:MarR family transcriptional regulator, lower aerobic nicotinate degradation pathway regulator
MARTRRYVLQEQVGFLLRKANQRHRTMFSDAIRPRLAPTQLAALATLRAEGPIHQNLLGRLAAMDSATITGVTERLVQRGLVTSSADPDDARLSIIELTEAGESLLDEVIPIALEVSAATLQPLSREESKEFLRMLHRIADAT